MLRKKLGKDVKETKPSFVAVEKLYGFFLLRRFVPYNDS